MPELEETLGSLALVPFHRSGGEQLATAVGEAIGGGAKLVLLERHGVVALGDSLEEAADRTELAELGARAILLAGTAS